MDTKQQGAPANGAPPAAQRDPGPAIKPGFTPVNRAPIQNRPMAPNLVPTQGNIAGPSNLQRPSVQQAHTESHPHTHPHPQPQSNPAYQAKVPSQRIKTFRSPGPRSKDPVFIRQVEQLSGFNASIPPDVIRQVVRDNWQTHLGGSEYHSKFVLNVLVNTMNPQMLRKYIRESAGPQLLGLTVEEALGQLDASALDNMAESIISKASNEFLDKALEARLHTIEAQTLVNALGAAKRLGYDQKDIVQPDLNDGHREMVITAPMPDRPSIKIKFRQQQAAAPKVTSADNSTSLPDDEQMRMLGITICSKCERPCSGSEALMHHARLCPQDRQGKTDKMACLHCGIWLSSAASLAYHRKHGVCGEYSQAVTTAMTALIRLYDKFNPQQPFLSSGTSTPSKGGATGVPQRTFASEQDAMLSLSPTKRAAVEAEMRAAEEQYMGRQAEAMTITDVATREDRLARLKAGFQSKQSLIRKKYGIRLRGRRSRAVMEAERARLSGNAQTASSRASPAAIQISSSDEDGASQNNFSFDYPLPTKNDVSIKAQSGLSGSTATAETQDPTAMAESTTSAVELTQSQAQNQQNHVVHVAPAPAPAAEPATTAASDPEAMAIDSDGTAQ